MKFVWIRIPFASSLLLIPAHLAQCYYLVWYAKECTACLQNQRYHRREFSRGVVQRHYPSLPLYVPTFIFKEKLFSQANVILKGLEWKLSFLLSSICFIIPIRPLHPQHSTKASDFRIFNETLLFWRENSFLGSFLVQFNCTSSVIVCIALKFDSTTFLCRFS